MGNCAAADLCDGGNAEPLALCGPSRDQRSGERVFSSPHGDAHNALACTLQDWWHGASVSGPLQIVSDSNGRALADGVAGEARAKSICVHSWFPAWKPRFNWRTQRRRYSQEDVTFAAGNQQRLSIRPYGSGAAVAAADASTGSIVSALVDAASATGSAATASAGAATAA